MALRFRTGLDADLFRDACEHMLRRFPVLGAVFGQRDGELFQRIPEAPRLEFAHERPDGLSETEIAELLRKKGKEPFDLEQGPLFRVHMLSPVSGDADYALLTVHHIVFDGRSAVLLVDALMEAYRELSAGQVPQPHATEAGYGEFVQWQRQFLDTERAKAQLEYWTSRLSGEMPVLSLPYDRGRSRAGSIDGASHELALPSALAREIGHLAKTLRVNLSVVFLGALKLLLYRYSGEDDIAVGMPTLGRSESRFDGAIGFFVNMIVVRSRVTEDGDTAGFLKDVQATVADGLDHADYPFPALLDALTAGRARGRSPLVQVMYAYQNFGLSGHANERTGAVLPTVEFLPGIAQEGTHDLALEVYREADGFRLRMDYDTGLFSPDAIRSAMEHYVRLLEAMCARPAADIADHALLSGEETDRILVEWNASDAACDTECGVVELFRRQARLTPEKTALSCGGRSLSYRELDRRSSQIASLLRARGMADGDAVGVCTSREPEAAVALLAIWKAGGVYVPFAPDYPERRLRHQLADSGARLLILDAKTRDAIPLPDGRECPVCLTIDDLGQMPGEPADEPAPPRRPDDAAYVIYTSGSTGEPKGVAISHRAIFHHCQVMRNHYGLTAADNVLQFASFNVDASLEQLLPGLLCGATVTLRPDDLWSARDFRRRIAELGVTVIDVPPSYLHELLLDADHASDWGALGSLRVAIAGGEALRPETARLWWNSPMRSCRLVNAYGPTETTVTSTAFDVSEAFAGGADIGGTVPIGRPLPGERVYILDARGRPVPVGVPGELHIGGAGLAIGYLNRPDLTREKFVHSPFDPDGRVYRTGDIAAWRRDGTIAFLGRRDGQVKVRGFRVECGEIEAALHGLDAVRQAAVVARPVNGGDGLVAFVVPAIEGSKDGELKRALGEVLPDHMIPALFVPLEDIPLTPGGKVDRAALRERPLDSPEPRDCVAPRTDIEARLAEIWRKALDVARIGVHDDFFDLGGNSLLALRLVALVHREFDRELPVSSLFAAPDIARQAELLQRDNGAWTPLVCLQAGIGAAPWFCIHAVSGDVLSYAELARRMDPARPVYALQAPDVAGGGHPGTIEGMAALYIDAIRTVQPAGPYHLGGWSMGGVIACEMARQLQQAGERIATLALIDSYTPDDLKAFEQDRRQRSGGAGENCPVAAFARELGIEDFAVGSATATDPVARLERLFHAARENSPLPPDIGPERLRRMFEANLAAMDSYVPGLYRGSAMLFAAAETTKALEGSHRDGWSEIISGMVTKSVVPGDHYSVLRPPHVQELAAGLVKYIDENAD